jgi:DNA-binding transcriptional LysR family regulator
MKIPRSTLEQWRILQAVVDCGGYAQAADAMHRSQSSVSYAIKQLQDQLGVQLLSIEGRKAKLTAEGATLLTRARHLLDDALRLEALAGSLNQGWEPQIRLVVDAAFPLPVLLRALQDFSAAHPNTQVQLKEVVLSGADEALQTQTADLVIGTRVPPGFLGDLLVEASFIAVAHPEHPLHQLGRVVTQDDLATQLQVVIEDSGRQNPRDEGWLGAERRWTVTSLETALASVASGLGFAWLPEHLIRESLAAGQVKPLPLHSGQRRQVLLYLVFAQPELAGPATRRLAEFIRHCPLLKA